MMHTWVQLLLIPNLSSCWSPTNITGVSPADSVNKAMFDEVGGEGFKEPAAKRPDDKSDENARVEIMPASGI